MSKLSILADTLRSNGAWKRSVRDSNPKDRWKYWALRLGLAILVIFVMYFIQHSPAPGTQIAPLSERDTCSPRTHAGACCAKGKFGSASGWPVLRLF
jgi:hypothetical protein